MIKQILIVDDEQLILTMLSRALNTCCGFKGEVRTVVNGREAICETSNCFYDICFLDLNLPDINGLDVMNEIKEISPKTKIVIMTGMYLEDEMKKTIEDNASLLVPKPMDLSQIKAFIDTVSGEDDCISQNCARQVERRPLRKADYSLSILDKIGMVNFKLEKGIVNRGDAEISIRINHPLKPGDVVSFYDGTKPRTGIVKWSDEMPDNDYRAGIEFI